MRNASDQRGENERQWKKKSKKEHKKQNILWAHATLSLLKGVTQRKFHAVVVRNNGKEIKKSVLDVQSVFFPSRCRRRLALHHLIFCSAMNEDVRAL